MKFCSNCGIQLEDDALFCTSCGSKVEDVVEPAQDEAPTQTVAQAEEVAPVVENVAPVEAPTPTQESVAPVEPTYAAQSVAPVEEPVAPVHPVTVNEPVLATQPVVTVASAPSNVSPTDAPSKGFFALGFFFFPVGLILYFIFKNRSPQRAKSALKGFIIGTCIMVALWILYVVIIAVFAVIAATAATSTYYY